MTADITGWCQRGKHTSCDGNLLPATGWHADVLALLDEVQP